MVVRIIVALIVILAILQGLVDAVPENIVSIALVILGLVYGGMALDAEDATSFLVVAIAVGAAAGADVLSNIPADIRREPGRHRRSDHYSPCMLAS